MGRAGFKPYRNQPHHIGGLTAEDWRRLTRIMLERQNEIWNIDATDTIVRNVQGWARKAGVTNEIKGWHVEAVWAIASQLPSNARDADNGEENHQEKGRQENGEENEPLEFTIRINQTGRSIGRCISHQILNDLIDAIRQNGNTED